MSSLEKYLSKQGRVISTNVGVSMLPLLRQGKDLFFIEKKGAGRCKVGDVVLYRRKRQYVLHRVIEVRPEDYVILGDNCAVKEYGIRDSDILATMTSFIRNGKEHTVNEAVYRLYSFLWLWTAPMRIFVKGKIIPLLKRLRKKRNWSQQFVADKLGLSNRTICKWETGRGTPKLATLLALSSLFYDFFRGLRYLCYDQLLGKEFLNIQRHHAGSSPFVCYLCY